MFSLRFLVNLFIFGIALGAFAPNTSNIVFIFVFVFFFVSSLLGLFCTYLVDTPRIENFSVYKLFVAVATGTVLLPYWRVHFYVPIAGFILFVLMMGSTTRYRIPPPETDPPPLSNHQLSRHFCSLFFFVFLSNMFLHMGAPELSIYLAVLGLLCAMCTKRFSGPSTAEDTGVILCFMTIMLMIVTSVFVLWTTERTNEVSMLNLVTVNTFHVQGCVTGQLVRLSPGPQRDLERQAEQQRDLEQQQPRPPYPFRSVLVRQTGDENLDCPCCLEETKERTECNHPLCSVCVEQLTLPRKCPMCRAHLLALSP